MPRKRRIKYPNAWYHVMNRGAGRRYVLRTSKHKKLFMELLEEASTMHNAEIHAYCLMGNHYHLLLRTPDANINDFMQHVACLYTKRFNKLHDSDGPIFRSRYKAIHVHGVKYLQRVHRYIHLNPVKANMVSDPRDFKWSSCAAYFDESKQQEWLQIEECLEYLGGQEVYSEYLAEGIDHDTLYFYSKQLVENYYGDKLDETIPELIVDAYFQHNIADRKSKKFSISNFIKAAVDLLEIHKNELFKMKSRNKYRHVIIYACRHLGGYSRAEICDYFDISRKNSLSQSLTRTSRKIESEEAYHELYNRLKKKL